MRITTNDFEATARTREEFPIAGATLLRVDGAFAMRFPAVKQPGGLLAVHAVNSSAMPLVPEGEYYILPGGFVAHRLQVKLWNAVIQGATIPPEVPRLTAAGTEEVSLACDPRALLEALDAMP